MKVNDEVNRILATKTGVSDLTNLSNGDISDEIVQRNSRREITASVVTSKCLKGMNKYGNMISKISNNIEILNYIIEWLLIHVREFNGKWTKYFIHNGQIKYMENNLLCSAFYQSNIDVMKLIIQDTDRFYISNDQINFIIQNLIERNVETSKEIASQIVDMILAHRKDLLDDPCINIVHKNVGSLKLTKKERFPIKNNNNNKKEINNNQWYTTGMAVIKYLKDNGNHTNEIEYCVADNDLEALKYLVEYNPRISWDHNTINYALNHGFMDIIYYLCSKKPYITPTEIPFDKIDFKMAIFLLDLKITEIQYIKPILSGSKYFNCHKLLKQILDHYGIVPLPKQVLYVLSGKYDSERWLWELSITFGWSDYIDILSENYRSGFYRDCIRGGIVMNQLDAIKKLVSHGLLKPEDFPKNNPNIHYFCNQDLRKSIISQNIKLNSTHIFLIENDIIPLSIIYVEAMKIKANILLESIRSRYPPESDQRYGEDDLKATLTIYY